MKISEESLKFLAELFNGDIGKFYCYKSGSMIFKFFNKYYGYNDRYSFNQSYPSRWIITYNKIVELFNKRLFNSFLSRILSLVYLRSEYPEKTNEELEFLSNNILLKINSIFEIDHLKVVKYLDSYKLEDINDDEILLGEGGYACCYFIKSLGIVEKRLKEENYLDKGVVSRFKREFNLTKSLNDLDGVIRVFDYNDKRISYTMEKAECDLYSFIIDNELDEKTKRNILYQIAYIMCDVHSRDAIHRDLSPKNIFLFSGRFKIADFGLGKDLNAFYSHQTMKTNSVGQYFYCDPRQFMLLKDGDKKTDIYSIGKLINFIYTKSPLDSNHKYYSVVEKATCDEKYRYSSINDLIDGLKNIDKMEEDNSYKTLFEQKICENSEFSVENINYIKTFDQNKMFQMIKKDNFRSLLVKARVNGLVDQNMFLLKIDLLIKYVSNNYIIWEEYDDLGDLGIKILLNKCSYIEKEKAVDLINFAVVANRFSIINRIKSEIIGNIEPSLEEKINANINNY